MNTFVTIIITSRTSIRLGLRANSLFALPISEQNMSKIRSCQNKMLRKIVGWVQHVLDEWETVMRNMKLRVTRAIGQHYVKPWDKSVFFPFFWWPPTLGIPRQKRHGLREVGKFVHGMGPYQNN